METVKAKIAALELTCPKCQTRFLRYNSVPEQASFFLPDSIMCEWCGKDLKFSDKLRQVLGEEYV